MDAQKKRRVLVPKFMIASAVIGCAFPFLQDRLSRNVGTPVSQYIESISTDGPFAATLEGDGCHLGPRHTAFRAGEYVGWLSNGRIHAGASVSGNFHVERIIDGHPAGFGDAYFDPTHPRPPGPQPFCVQIAADAPPGRYQVSRSADIYPPDGRHLLASFAPVGPFEVLP